MTKSLCFESKLRGRLALLDETGGLSREVAHDVLAKRHGSRLAILVGQGNADAISLIDLQECRNNYINSNSIDPALLVEYDEAIEAHRQCLCLSEGTDTELSEMLRLASGPGFSSPRHFSSHLSEGLILNVNTMASRALSIPSGEYVVWTTDPGHTMLVPTTEAHGRRGDVLSDGHGLSGYEIYTRELVGCWNKLERLIGERGERVWHKTAKSGVVGGGREPRVSKGGMGRPNLRNARLSTGKSLTNVSDATGWSIPTIAKAELYSKDDASNPHAPSYDVIDDLITYYGADYKDAFRTGPVEPYGDTVQTMGAKDSEGEGGGSQNAPQNGTKNGSERHMKPDDHRK